MRPIQIYNPLPQALHHYTEAVRASVATEVDWRVVAGRGVESVSGSLPARAAAHLRAQFRAARELPLLVVWPAFGHLESALVAPGKAPRALVIHDPEPLRRQVGHSALSVHGGAWLARMRHLQIICHSQRASEVLREQGYTRIAHLPHPMHAPSGAVRRESVLRVLGQNKDARDMVVLEAVGLRLSELGLRGELVGRGWPHLPGWTTRDEFVPEEEFSELVASSAAVMLPYRHFFQSGVAVRAAEAGVPVIGPAEGQLSEMFGGDYPGLVHDGETESWMRAVSSVLEDPHCGRRGGEEAYATSARAWSSFLIEWSAP